jgi:hypothetical protein
MKYRDFINPPKGYGNVPFYWWNGDKLDKNRIEWQLEKLAENGVSGVQINFAHHCPAHRPDKAGGGFGKTYDCDPEAFSDEWWKIVNHVFRKAKSLGMGVGISDYTIGWIGNGYFIDKVAIDAKLCAEELHFIKTEVKKGETYSPDKPDGFISAAALFADGSWQPVDDLLTAENDCEVYVVYKKVNPRSVNVLDPAAGRLLAKVFFEYFEEHLDEDVRDALNYCFQDEFIPGCDIAHIWSESLRERIIKEKGYDIAPRLFELFAKTPGCVKTRLDYCDVKAAMTEEGYFKPVYDFHASRGLIYGCDQCSRGLSPGEYGDYFRAVRWFTAPGNDTPLRAAYLIKDKVSSSIAHLYGHERTWLEGYHSSGWGTSLSSLQAPTSDNFIYGMNLLCMHGLYYSTYGGFWEWAPPDFHFRMPYWEHSKSFYGYYERLSYLLTRGKHVCDAALFYPVSSCDANLDPETSVKAAFSAASALFENGIDFDFIDFQSVNAAGIKDGKLCVAGEKYKCVILASVDCVRHSMFEKLIAFQNAGGKLIIVGDPPAYTDVINDGILADIPSYRTPDNNGLIELINGIVSRDFETVDGSGANVLHRHDGDTDIYFVRNLKKGTVCRFDCEGTVEAWFADGKKRLLLDSEKQGPKTLVSVPFDGDNLIVFNRSVDTATEKYVKLGESVEEIALDGEWNFSLRPTLDNRWGDFRLPVTEDFIGPEIRFISVDGRKQTVSQYDIWKKTTPDGKTEAVSINDRYGIVTGQPHEQGYHGLKKEVYDWNVILQSGEKAVFAAEFYADCDLCAEILTDGIMPKVTMIDRDIIRDFSYITVSKGPHRISVEYENTENTERRGYLVIKDKSKQSVKTGLPLTNRWFADKSLIRFSKDGFAHKVTVCSGIAPGTEKIEAVVFGKITFAKINGGGATVEKTGERNGANIYLITAGDIRKEAGYAILDIEPFTGYCGGAIFPEPLREKCGKGRTELCDISKVGGLESYSGMFIYEKTVEINKKQGMRYILSLGTVACSGRVTVNGKTAAVSCVPPFDFDITGFICDGENSICIEVANTLCNHYSTNPSPYSNYPQDSVSGLIGPVKIKVYE